MSLLLCRQENVRHPYYMEALGVHLYSSQELSYVIFNHPLLVMDGFIDNRLLEFLREELNMGFLALKIERFLRGGGNSDEALGMILRECDYYNASEIARFRQLVSNFRSKHKADYLKTKADELFSMRQYGKAAAVYEHILKLRKDNFVNDAFVGKVWNNLAACHARMFQLELAMEAFEKAYLRTGQKSVLEQMVALTILDPKLKLGERLKDLVDEEMSENCKRKVEAAREKAQDAEKVRRLEELFQKDSLKRREGETALLGQWKREYRRIR